MVSIAFENSNGGATSGRLLRSRWMARVWRTELGFFGGLVRSSVFVIRTFCATA